MTQQTTSPAFGFARYVVLLAGYFAFVPAGNAETNTIAEQATSQTRLDKCMSIMTKIHPNEPETQTGKRCVEAILFMECYNGDKDSCELMKGSNP
jgi:hypothetical protein